VPAVLTTDQDPRFPCFFFDHFFPIWNSVRFEVLGMSFGFHGQVVLVPHAKSAKKCKWDNGMIGGAAEGIVRS